LQSGIEQLSGISMHDVSVHYNSPHVRPIGAEAYASGNDIHLAPGQERHLPHEAWHVVQQKQGRVRPSPSNLHGVPIYENPALEIEADQMGAKAVNVSRTRNWQHSHRPPIGSHIQHPVIQRAASVPTNFGEFETTNFAASNNRGVQITLLFKPDEAKVDARKIALSQSVKATMEDGTVYAPDPNKAARMVGSGKSGAGYVIDAPGTTNNPIYFDTKNLGARQTLKDTPESANTTSNRTQLGTNTNYELGHCFLEKPSDASKKKHPAGLVDRPEGRKKKGAGMEFETAAFAIEGADVNKYYGSVKWGFKMEGTDAAPTVTPIDISEASKGTPTVNFSEAAKLWNNAKTQGTLKVSANPATVTKSDLVTTETLAAGTRVKMLDTVAGGPKPMIKVEVLNANGTGTGKIVYINVVDVQDMGDGSANKKLPV